MEQPLGMYLWKGGLGEPLPAEAWQQVANFHRSAVPDLLADHDQTFAGVPVHSGLRWARAAAIVEIAPMQAGMVDPPRATVLAAIGFAEAPRLVVREGARSAPVQSLGRRNNGPGRGLVMEWRLTSRAPQYILYGWRARVFGGDMQPYMQPYDHGQGRGELWLGEWREETPDFDGGPSPQLLNVGAVFLLIR